MRKRRVKIYGGRAGYNSVSFTGGKYQVISRFKNSKITTETRINREGNKIVSILSKIPFVRSFLMLFEVLIEFWKRFLLVTIVFFLVSFFLIERSNSIFVYTIPINGLEMLSIFLVMAGLIIKISPLAKYHSGEHKAFSAYEKGLNLTLENVRGQPRTHRKCGTNLVATFFICFSILFIAFGDSVFVYLIAWMIGFEIWRNEPKIIWALIVVIGKAAQYLLFTSQPQEKHLIVAIEALTRLEEVEIANAILKRRKVGSDSK
ncbi:DUF1385 domain-containing protein [Niallia sp. JL1B1071]|uniref:DUF1385 domain-containing protein n=1 Tax=Niallia tiangongensis TaxID=3237105 RepID=UPI0037DDD925